MKFKLLFYYWYSGNMSQLHVLQFFVWFSTALLSLSELSSAANKFFKISLVQTYWFFVTVSNM